MMNDPHDGVIEFSASDYRDLLERIRYSVKRDYEDLGAILSNNLNVLLGALRDAAEAEAREHAAELRGFGAAISYVGSTTSGGGSAILCHKMRAELARRREGKV